MRKSIALIAFTVMLQTSFASRPALHWLEGSWVGTGGDVNSTFTWTISLTYKANDKSIQLTYPSHNCGGSLKILTIENGKANCIEDLNYGLGQCNTGLNVTVQQESDGSISLIYYNSGSTLPKSTAKLKRQAI